MAPSVPNTCPSVPNRGTANTEALIKLETIERPKGVHVAGAHTMNERKRHPGGGRGVGKGHVTWGLAGLEEETGFYSRVIGKPLQSLKERGGSI